MPELQRLADLRQMQPSRMHSGINDTIDEIAITIIVVFSRFHERHQGRTPHSMPDLGLFADFCQTLFPFTLVRHEHHSQSQRQSSQAVKLIGN
jgi:hypothetical protein